jgi:hypothetical protein
VAAGSDPAAGGGKAARAGMMDVCRAKLARAAAAVTAAAAFSRRSCVAMSSTDLRVRI